MTQAVAKMTLKFLALCNLFFSALGVVDMHGAVQAFPILRKNALAVRPPVPWIDNPFPHLDAVFYTLAAINLAFIILLVLCSVFVWRLTARGRFVLNLLFAAELSYWIGFTLFKMFLGWAGDSGALLRTTVLYTGPLANSGISAQLTLAYPVIGLIVGNIAYWILGRRPLDTQLAS